MAHPEFGHGAAALRAHLFKHDRTITNLARAVGAAKSSVHAWLNAGWLSGGGLPDAFHRRRVEIATDGEAPAYLFDLDDVRRREHRRASIAEAA